MLTISDARRHQRVQASRARPQHTLALACYRRAAAVAAEHCGVELREVLATRRRKGKVAEARQIAAYLTVICFNVSRRRVALITGVNTMVIGRSCAAIENRRERPAADAAIAGLEARLRT